MTLRRSFAFLAFTPAIAALAVAACSSSSSGSGGSGAGGKGSGGHEDKDPGAIVDATMTSTVGVLLDEVPSSMRDRVAQSLIAKPASFWTDRAKTQIGLTAYRLVFRQNYYDFTEAGDPTKDSLPIPLPDQWNVTLSGAPKRATVSGHDLVTVDYQLSTTILTDYDSPGHSEPKLAKTGGTWDEPFIFPIDPELVLQRTGYACMDEAEFPPNSVDSEEVDSFYDQSCGVEGMQTKTGCHYSQLPQLSCTDALDQKIGKVETKLHFERKAWDLAAADKARAGEITTKQGADLKVFADEFHQNRLIYRYITPDSCTLVEGCVGASGWRRLLQFSTADSNNGNATLAIGSVDYFGEDDAGTPLSKHGVFEWSACHEHFHFTHYGSFSYGAGNTAKRGFCLQSTKRTSNNELSPLSNPYYDCGYQGIEVGWADEYKAGLECQWVDVTGEDTKTAPVTHSLSFHSNPDGFLCEGNPVLDKNGDQVWTPTDFKTATGQAVDKPACTFADGWDKNNVDSYDVTLPLDGNGYVTADCSRGQLGPLRNCGWKKVDDTLKCTPGQPVKLSCSIPAGSAAQSVRVCETSAVLQTGIPCIFDQSLTVGNVEDSGPTVVSFTCPAARDANEPGGGYALYTGAVFTDDAAAAVTCSPM